MLVVHDVHQHYGGSHILRGVSLEVRAGEVTAVLGRNGVGKTTLLRAIMGLVPASAGQVRLGEEDLTRASTHARARAGLGYVPQGRDIFPRLTVRENLEVGLAARRAPGGGADALERSLDLFPALRAMLRRRGGDLSGGQQQQLAIARALVAGPAVLVLDEPTEGIQPSIIKDIGRALRTLAAEGRLGILLVEQYYDFARELCDRYLLLQRGEVIAAGAGPDMERDGVRRLLAV